MPRRMMGANIHSKIHDCRNLESLLTLLNTAFQQRLTTYFSEGADPFDISNLSIPKVIDNGSAFSKFMKERGPSIAEYLTIGLALAPHLQANFLQKAIMEQLPASGDFSEVGGIKTADGRGFLPTGETVLFLLAGNDLAKRQYYLSLFDTQHWFRQSNMLHLNAVKNGTPRTQGQLMLDKEYVELFTTNKISPPMMSMDFPAQLLQSRLDWQDLVLAENTAHQLEEIRIWVDHHRTLYQDWGLSKKIKPGYRALFHGPPGTGKTLTATLLGKRTGKDVFRIDLSSVVSKYIGETEKNLATLFDKAQHKEWILFFDEADSLFGKRTNVRDAHDKYANQEVSYLLQRIEEFDGMVILASNFKNNIDDAFSRRFQSIIYFPLPKASERLQLWEKSFPKKVQLESRIDLRAVSKQFELTGANIINVVQYCCLRALARSESVILLRDLRHGIRKELRKEGKLL